MPREAREAGLDGKQRSRQRAPVPSLISFGLTLSDDIQLAQKPVPLPFPFMRQQVKDQIMT